MNLIDYKFDIHHGNGSVKTWLSRLDLQKKAIATFKSETIVRF